MNSSLRRYARFGLALLVAVLVLASVPSATMAAARVEDTPQVTTHAWFFGCTTVVRPGDNLFRIGLRFGVSPWVLAAMNGLPNVNLVFAGMVLRVPCGPSPIVFPPFFPPPMGGVCSVHFVQFGEWLGLIAARHGTTVWAIAALNQLPNPNFIFVGQRLLIPCSGFGIDP